MKAGGEFLNPKGRDMIFAYLTLVFIFLGILLWSIAGFIDRRLQRSKSASRKNYQKIVRYFGIFAKISLILQPFPLWSRLYGCRGCRAKGIFQNEKNFCRSHII